MFLLGLKGQPRNDEPINVGLDGTPVIIGEGLSSFLL